MLIKDIALLGKMLAQFLARLLNCFARPAGRRLLAVYVKGLVSTGERKNAEAMTLAQGIAPRTLQRFLKSIVWDEEQLHDQCQRIIATEHPSPDALVDETSITTDHHTNRSLGAVIIPTAP